MKIHQSTRLLFLLIVFLFLHGCSTAHIKVDIHEKNLKGYENILIQGVRVYSNEAAAKNNAPLQEKLKNWELFSRNQLEEYAINSNYNLIKSLDRVDGKTLLIDLDVNVQYGNRALRWAVGFGAGKGGVYSVLTVKDSTGEIKYKAQADSDLSMGGAGGDIGAVLEKNIKKLIKQYRDTQI